jgi:RHS repeat-associated protein
LRQRLTATGTTITASTPEHFLSDANNNTIAITNAATTPAITTRYDYSAYGESTTTTVSGTQSDNSQQYTGRENDSTGLMYYRARYYLPGCARFISEDPIGWASGQTNNYAYVAGNPIRFRDPRGLRPLSDCEKSNLSPYVPKVDLDNANLNLNGLPWWGTSDALCITTGNDINCKSGVYDPAKPGVNDGLGLLAHELYHVGDYRTGNLTKGKYLWEAAKNGSGTANKYEKPAYELGSTVANDLAAKHGDNPICSP